MRCLMAIFAICFCAGGVHAQTRVRVTVDYVTASSVYLSAGQQQGLFAGDTVRFQRDSLAAPAGMLLVVSSSRARAVVTPSDSTVKLNRGDIIFLTLPEAALQRLALVSDSVAEAPLAPPMAAPVEPVRPARERSALRASGRIGLEMDALRTWARYGPGENQVQERDYFSPAMRLRLRADGLPGGMRFSTNLRATYLDAGPSRPRELNVQVYQASVEADIRSAGVHLQLGRFYNSYESHSGYWDGMLVRVGSSHMGAGVVAGYAPAHGNQNLSSVAPKFSAFVDAHARSGKLRYDVDVSAHQQSNVFVIGEQREFLGVSQGIAYGRTYFTQRVQVGRNGGEFELWQAQLTGSAAVAGPLSVHARFTTERNDAFFHSSALPGHRTRWSAGAVLAGRAGYANAEAGAIDSGLGTRARIASGGFFLPRILAVAGLGFSGSTSRDDNYTTSYLAPFIERSSGRFRARLAGTYYRTDFGNSVFEQKGGDLTLTLPLGRRSELGLTGAATTGSSMRTARTAISFWQSF
jgi:hypothetical protein